jgi:hypothetical protein
VSGPIRPVRAASVHAKPLGLRLGLRRLSTGLLAYGAIGMVLVVLGLIATIWVGGRLGSLSDRLSTQVESVAATLESSGAALTDAGATASSFSTTLTETSQALDGAAASIATVSPKLADLEAQFRSINILGNQPLANAADVIASINTSLTGLDTRLHAISTSLTDNQAKLEANATSLTALGTRLTTLAGELRSGVVDDSLDDVRLVVVVSLLLLLTWTALPAVGALALGEWLRRTLGPATHA